MKNKLLFIILLLFAVTIYITAVLTDLYCSSKMKYEGFVIDHTEDGLLLEVEVKVTPEEMIAYEPGDPYIIGGK